MSLIFVYLGTFIWVLINSVGTKNNCQDFPQKGFKINVCPSKGPKYFIVMLCTSPMITLAYVAIMLKFDKKRNSVENEYPDFTMSVISTARPSLIGYPNEFGSNLNMRFEEIQGTEEIGLKSFHLTESQKESDPNTDNPLEVINTDTPLNKDNE